MKLNLLHIYRNTPLGRETLLQAADFVKKVNGELHIYIPQFDRFLFYFGDKSSEVRLDKSYLFLLETSLQNIKSTLNPFALKPNFITPVSMVASGLPRLVTDFDILSLPRVMFERKGQLHLGSLGTGVRRLIKNIHTPTLIAPGHFHNWQEILVMFGGSDYSVTALKWGQAISQKMQIPLNLLTLSEKDKKKADYEETLHNNKIQSKQINRWQFIESKSSLYLLNEIPRTSLIVMGAYGHGRIFAKLLGSNTELVQNNTASLIMLVGENCKAPEV